MSGILTASSVFNNPGSAPPSFIPSDLSGLVIWGRNGTGLFQDTGKTTPAGVGDPVGAWADQSGNGNDLLLPAGGLTKPTLQAGGAVTFDGVLNMLAALANQTLKPATFFCSVHFTSVAGNNPILWGTGGLGLNANTTFLQLNKAGFGVIATSSIQVSTTGYFSVIVTYSGTGDYAFYVNGADGGTGNNDQTLVAVNPGIGDVGGAGRVSAAIKDWGVYDTVYSGANITSLNTYLTGL